MKGVDDSFTDQNPVFSSVVEFINENSAIKASTVSCHFMSTRTATFAVRNRTTKKVFRYSPITDSMERCKGNEEANTPTIIMS